MRALVRKNIADYSILGHKIWNSNPVGGIANAANIIEYVNMIRAGSAVFTTADINGGTIDGTTIGVSAVSSVYTNDFRTKSGASVTSIIDDLGKVSLYGLGGVVKVLIDPASTTPSYFNVTRITFGANAGADVTYPFYFNGAIKATGANYLGKNTLIEKATSGTNNLTTQIDSFVSGAAQWASILGITAAELNQLKEIGTTTISAAQWLKMSTMQNVDLGASVTFGTVNCTDLSGITSLSLTSLTVIGVATVGSLASVGVITGASLAVGAGAITGGLLTVTGIISGASLAVGAGAITGGSLTVVGIITGASLAVGDGAITGGIITGASLDVGTGSIICGDIAASASTSSFYGMAAYRISTYDRIGIPGSNQAALRELNVGGSATWITNGIFSQAGLGSANGNIYTSSGNIYTAGWISALGSPPPTSVAGTLYGLHAHIAGTSNFYDTMDLNNSSIIDALTITSGTITAVSSLVSQGNATIAGWCVVGTDLAFGDGLEYLAGEPTVQLNQSVILTAPVLVSGTIKAMVKKIDPSGYFANDKITSYQIWFDFVTPLYTALADVPVSLSALGIDTTGTVDMISCDISCCSSAGATITTSRLSVTSPPPGSTRYSSNNAAYQLSGEYYSGSRLPFNPNMGIYLNSLSLGIQINAIAPPAGNIPAGSHLRGAGTITIYKA